MNIFDEINLPQASKYLVSLILKKGGSLLCIPGTNAYLSKFKGKEYIFLGDFTPLTPYMYGIVFSNQKYWSEVVKDLNMKHVWTRRKSQKKIFFLMTKNGFYNALQENEIVLTGNGKDNLGTLIKDENMKRINRKEKFIMPINIKSAPLNLKLVLKDGEKMVIPDNYDYEDATSKINKTIIKSVGKIVESLPGLPFIRTEILVRDLERAHNFVFGRVSISPGVNIFRPVTDGKKSKNAGTVLFDLMCSQFC